MTATQRRNHLFGIFFVQTVSGRDRRAATAVEECLKVARRKSAKQVSPIDSDSNAIGQLVIS